MQPDNADLEKITAKVSRLQPLSEGPHCVAPAQLLLLPTRRAAGCAQTPLRSHSRHAHLSLMSFMHPLPLFPSAPPQYEDGVLELKIAKKSLPSEKPEGRTIPIA